jgi:hypothetical protein
MILLNSLIEVLVCICFDMRVWGRRLCERVSE